MVIKSRMMRWTGHVAHKREMRNAYRIFVGKPKGRDHAEDLGIGKDSIRMDPKEIG
jgi:hypothetical protein